jgi:hypothetical protein
MDRTEYLLVVSSYTERRVLAVNTNIPHLTRQIISFYHTNSTPSSSTSNTKFLMLLSHLQLHLHNTYPELPRSVLQGRYYFFFFLQ